MLGAPVGRVDSLKAQEAEDRLAFSAQVGEQAPVLRVGGGDPQELIEPFLELAIVRRSVRTEMLSKSRLARSASASNSSLRAASGIVRARPWATSSRLVQRLSRCARQL